jgi:hypothetical protein
LFVSPVCFEIAAKQVELKVRYPEYKIINRKNDDKDGKWKTAFFILNVCDLKFFCKWRRNLIYKETNKKHKFSIRQSLLP